MLLFSLLGVGKKIVDLEILGKSVAPLYSISNYSIYKNLDSNGDGQINWSDVSGIPNQFAEEVGYVWDWLGNALGRSGDLF